MEELVLVPVLAFPVTLLWLLIAPRPRLLLCNRSVGLLVVPHQSGIVPDLGHVEMEWTFFPLVIIPGSCHSHLVGRDQGC